jgi:hypothetical protein
MLVGALIVAALWRRSPERTVVVNHVVHVHLDASSAALVETRVDASQDTIEHDTSPPRGTAERTISTTATEHRTLSSRTSSDDALDLSLRAERELIETAQSALARRQWRDAIRACETHLRRFTRAELVEEREAIWVQALAGDGRAAEAWARAESFRRRFATSLLRPVVDRAAPPVEPSSADR